MAPCTMPAPWRRVRSAHSPSRASSLMSGRSRASGVPSGRTTTRASPCPALPADTSRAVRTPARSESRVTKPSCSTSSSRLSRAVRWDERYQARRQRLASSWASQASRPYTLTSSGPWASRPVKRTTPSGCIRAGASSSTSTPRSRSASTIRDGVGRPPGEPTTRWIADAATSPTIKATRPPLPTAMPRNMPRDVLAGEQPASEVPGRTDEVGRGDADGGGGDRDQPRREDGRPVDVGDLASGSPTRRRRRWRRP